MTPSEFLDYIGIASSVQSDRTSRMAYAYGAYGSYCEAYHADLVRLVDMARHEPYYSAIRKAASDRASRTPMLIVPDFQSRQEAA